MTEADWTDAGEVEWDGGSLTARSKCGHFITVEVPEGEHPGDTAARERIFERIKAHEAICPSLR